MERLLELILDYKLTKVEATAWKVAILYISGCKKYLDRNVSIRGDPRKTELFRYCYKLIQNPDLYPKDYNKYVQAQFQILKSIKKEEYHVLISPNCLVGEAAWNRWLVWQKKYENTAKTITFDGPQEVDIISELAATKKFLLTKFEVNKKNILDALEGRALFRWTVLQLVSPYFLVLSPTVQEWLGKNAIDLLENYVIDLKFYKPTEEAKKYYGKEFGDAL